MNWREDEAKKPGMAFATHCAHRGLLAGTKPQKHLTSKGFSSTNRSDPLVS
jgi:hypothetical protein